MTIGSGIGVAGMWLAVGFASMFHGDAIWGFVPTMFATFAIAGWDDD